MKNNNRSRFISVIAAAVLLTGCSGLNRSSSSEKSEPTTAGTTTAENTTESAATESGPDSSAEAAKVEIVVPEKTDINIGYLNSTAHLLAFVAAEEGYFKEEGLAVLFSCLLVIVCISVCLILTNLKL